MVGLVLQTVEAAELKRAYRKLSLQLHPDKNKEQDAEIKFRQVLYFVLFFCLHDASAVMFVATLSGQKTRGICLLKLTVWSDLSDSSLFWSYLSDLSFTILAASAGVYIFFQEQYMIWIPLIDLLGQNSFLNLDLLVPCTPAEMGRAEYCRQQVITMVVALVGW